jgi:hypothetical protein
MAGKQPEHLRQADRNIELLTEFAIMLRKYPGEQEAWRESQLELLEAISTNLSQLRTARTGYLELRSRDIDNDPSFQGRYRTFIQITEQVGTFCTVELVSDVERLHGACGSHPLAAELERLLQRARMPESLDWRVGENRREERAAGISGVADSRTERKPTDEDPGSGAGVKVSEALLENLRIHQVRLADHIQGYIRCQEMEPRLQEAASNFDEARERGLRPKDWESTRRFVNDVLAMVKGLSPAFKDEEDTEVRESFSALGTAVTNATAAVRGVAGQAGTPEKAGELAGHLGDMRYALESLTNLCLAKANGTLGDLRDVINQIVGQMEMQRSVRQRLSEPTDKQAGKTWRQTATAMSDSTVRKGA